MDNVLDSGGGVEGTRGAGRSPGVAGSPTWNHMTWHLTLEAGLDGWHS